MIILFYRVILFYLLLFKASCEDAPAETAAPSVEAAPTAAAADASSPSPDAATSEASGASPAPADGASPAPADGTSPAPADGASAAPADGASEAPADGSSAAPAEGATVAPAEGASAAPADSSSSAPAEGGVTAPGAGSLGEESSGAPDKGVTASSGEGSPSGSGDGAGSEAVVAGGTTLPGGTAAVGINGTSISSAGGTTIAGTVRGIDATDGTPTTSFEIGRGVDDTTTVGSYTTGDTEHGRGVDDHEEGSGIERGSDEDEEGRSDEEDSGVDGTAATIGIFTDAIVASTEIPKAKDHGFGSGIDVDDDSMIQMVKIPDAVQEEMFDEALKIRNDDGEDDDDFAEDRHADDEDDDEDDDEEQVARADEEEYDDGAEFEDDEVDKMIDIADSNKALNEAYQSLYGDDEQEISEDEETATPFELPYDFVELDYGKFINLSTSDFDENILGIYALKLGFHLRNNLINLLGYVMHQPYHDIGEDVFLKLYTLKNAFHMNLVDVFELLPVLANVTSNDANRQVMAILDKVEEQLDTKHCHVACASKSARIKLQKKQIDIRRIIAHLAYNVLINNIYDQINRKGIKEIKVVADRIERIAKEEEGEEEMFKLFSPVICEVLREIRDGKLLFSEATVGYLLPFFPWPVNDFKVSAAVDDIVLVLTNERDYMARCRIIPEGMNTMVDHPIEMLTWVLTKILDDICYGSLHAPAKILLSALMSGRLKERPSTDIVNNENFIEINAVADLLDIITFEKYPVEVILAKDRIRLYLNKVMPFIDTKSFFVYHYDTTEAKLYAFLGYILQINPHVHTDIKNSILAVRAHLVFQIRPMKVKLDVLIELTHAWLAPDLLQDIREQATDMRYFLYDESDGINKEVFSKPYKVCESLLHCIVRAREVIKQAKLKQSAKPLKVPSCVAERFLKQKYFVERQTLEEIPFFDAITETLYSTQTITAANAVEAYFSGTDPVLKNLEIDVQCTQPEILLQGLKVVISKLTDLPEGVVANVNAIIAELEFKINPKSQLDTSVIYTLQTIFKAPDANKETLTMLLALNPFLEANEEAISKVLYKVDPDNCRDLFSCYNLIADKINQEDFSDNIPYAYGQSPTLEELDFIDVNFNPMTVNKTLMIIDAVDKNFTCSSEITAGKRHMFDHETEIDAVLAGVNCDGMYVEACLDLVFQTLLYNKEKLRKVQLNILQFLLHPTVCTQSNCQWKLYEERGSVVLNPLLEYMISLMKEKSDEVASIHVQIDLFGIIGYIRRHNIEAVLDGFNLRSHVVDETAITAFLNMIYELPTATNNIKISIENLNTYFLNMTNATTPIRANVVLLLGLGKILSTMTSTPEVIVEIEYRMMDIAINEDKVMNLFEDFQIQCSEAVKCAQDIVKRYTDIPESIPKMVYRTIAPAACTNGNCPWLATPAESSESPLMNEILTKLDKQEQGISIVEKVQLEDIMEHDMAFELKKQTLAPTSLSLENYTTAQPTEKSAEGQESDQVSRSNESDASDEGDRSDASEESKGGEERDEHARSDETEDHDKDSKSDDGKESEGDARSDKTDASEEGARSEESDESAQGARSDEGEAPEKSERSDKDGEHEVDVRSGKSLEHVEGARSDEGNRTGDAAGSDESQNVRAPLHKRTKKLQKVPSIMNLIATTPKTALPVTLLPPSWWKGDGSIISRSLLKIGRRAREFAGQFQQVYETLQKQVMELTAELTTFTALGVDRLLAVLLEGSHNNHFRKMIEKSRGLVKGSAGSTNAKLSEISIVCENLEHCLWSLHDGIVKAGLESNIVFKSILDILRAEDCPHAQCPHQLVVSQQKFYSFLEMIITSLEQAHHPTSSSFHLHTDIENVIAFLKRSDVIDFLPKNLAFMFKSSDVLKDTLTKMLKTKIPIEVKKSIENIIGLLYEDRVPKYINADNLDFMIRTFFGMVKDVNVQNELLVLQQTLMDRRDAITKLLSDIPVNCVTLETCVQTLESKLLEKKSNSIAKYTLKMIRPAACAGSKCKWLEQSLQVKLPEFKKNILLELDLWHQHCDNYLLQIDFQQAKYIILAENSIEHYLSLDVDADSPVLGILQTLDSVIRARYDMLEGIQNLMVFMMVKETPSTILYRQLKHIAQKLQTKTDYVPALITMEESYDSFHADMEGVRKKLADIQLTCATFSKCVRELIEGVNYQEDPISKIILNAIAPQNCPVDKCPWMEKDQYDEISKKIKIEFDVKVEDLNVPIIVKLKILDIVSKMPSLDLEKVFSETNVNSKNFLVAFLQNIVKTLKLDQEFSGVVKDVIKYLESTQVPTVMRYVELHLILLEMIEVTRDPLVKADLQAYQNLFIRYREEVDNVLKGCTIKCITLKGCVDSIIICAQYSKDKYATYILECMSPPSCTSHDSCPWLSKLPQVEVTEVAPTLRNEESNFPHNLIIFPPPDEGKRAITLSLGHPGHIGKLLEIFPSVNDPKLGKHQTIYTLKRNGKVLHLVFDFTISGIFKSLYKITSKRRPMINMKTFKHVLIFVPMHNGVMRAVRINFEPAGIAESFEALAKNMTKKQDKPSITVVNFDGTRSTLYIDLFDQALMNQLMALSSDKVQTSGHSVLVWPGEVGEPWRCLSAEAGDSTVWNVLDLFSTVSSADKPNLERVTADGLTVFNFDVYDPVIALHLNSLWKTVPQLDVSIVKKYVFYLPFKPGQFSGLDLDLDNELILVRLKQVSDKTQIISKIPSFQVIGHEEYPDGLDIILNFDAPESFDKFIILLTEGEVGYMKALIKRIALVPVHKDEFVILLWDLPEVVDAMLEFAQGQKGNRGRYKLMVPVAGGESVPVSLSLKSPVVATFLEELMNKTLIPFSPIKVKTKLKTLFAMAIVDEGKTIPIVIEDEAKFQKELAVYNIPKGKQASNATMERFMFKSNETINVDVSSKEVIALLRRFNKARGVVPVEEELPEIILPQVTEDRHNFIHMNITSKDDITAIKKICGSSNASSGEPVDMDITAVSTAKQSAKRETIHCNLNAEVIDQLEAYIKRIQTLPAKHSLAIINIPDDSGILHPMVLDLRLQAIRRILRILSRRALPESTNKVAIYYMDKLRLPETFVIDYDVTTPQKLKDVADLTPCSIMPTDITHPKTGRDLLVFTVPSEKKANATCDHGHTILLDPNNDFAVRELERLVEKESDGAIIPITYPNNETKPLTVPYFNNESIIERLEQISFFSPEMSTPSMNHFPVLTIEFGTVEGLVYMVTLNTTQFKTMKVLKDISEKAMITVPVALIRGPNNVNYEIKLDLHDATVQKRLMKVAMNVMQIPRQNSLLLVRPPGTTKTIIVDTSNEKIMKALMKMNKQDKGKKNLHVIIVRDKSGNRRVMRIDLSNKKNIELLEELEKEEKKPEEDKVVEMPDEKTSDGRVLIDVNSDNGTVVSVVLDVKNQKVVQSLLELNEPTNPKAILIPTYDKDLNQILVHIDPWNPYVAARLEEISKLSSMTGTQQNPDEESGIVDIPLEFTKSGVLVVQCNSSDPDVVAQIFKLAGVRNGDKNAVYFTDPATGEKVALYFNPMDTQLVKQLRVICPMMKLITPEEKAIVMESVDDKCQPQTYVLSPDSSEVASNLDMLTLKRNTGKKLRKNVEHFEHRNPDGSMRVVSIDISHTKTKKVFGGMQYQMNMTIEPMILPMARRRILVISITHNRVTRELAFDISNPSVLRALRSMALASNGRGIKIFLGKNDFLILDVFNNMIRENLLSLYKMYSQEFVKVPDPVIEGGKAQIPVENQEGDIFIEEVATTTRSVEVKAMAVDYPEYYQGENPTSPPKIPAIDIPDSATKRVNIEIVTENADASENFNVGNEIPGPPIIIDPPVTAGEATTEPPVTETLIIAGEIAEDKIKVFVPDPYSMVMIYVQEKKLTGILLFDLRHESVYNRFVELSATIRIYEATHIFIVQINYVFKLIKVNVKDPEFLIALIEISKITKNRLQPTEFPKCCGPGHYVVFTILDTSREIQPVVIDSANAQALAKLKKLHTEDGHDKIRVIISGSDPREYLVDVADPQTIKELLKITRDTPICKEALKNVPMYNGVYQAMIKFPVELEDGTTEEYIFDANDAKAISALETASAAMSSKTVPLVLYIRKKDATVAIKVDVVNPPKRKPDMIETKFNSEDALIFFLGEPGNTEVIVLDRSMKEVIDGLADFVRESTESNQTGKIVRPYSVFNILHPDGYPLEIKLNLEDKATYDLLKNLSQYTLENFTPFEVASTMGSSKITVLPLDRGVNTTIIALNQNNKEVIRKIRTLFDTTVWDIFHIIRDNENKLKNPKIVNELIELSKKHLQPQEVPTYMPDDYLYFTLIDEESNLLKLMIDIGDPIQLGKLLAMSVQTYTQQDLVWKTFVYDAAHETSVVVKIDVGNPANVQILKEIAKATAYPARHEVYPPGGSKPLNVISIANHGMNYNLTINPNDQRVIATLEHAFETYPSILTPKLPFVNRQGNNIRVPLRKEEYTILSELSPFQITPIQIVPPNGSAPLLNMMIPMSHGDWDCVTIDINNNKLLERLSPFIPDDSVHATYIVFYNEKKEKVKLPLNLTDEKTVNELKQITTESGIAIVPRRFKYPLLKLYDSTGRRVVLDLQLSDVKSALHSIAKKEDRDARGGLTEIELKTIEGLSQVVMVPIIDPKTGFFPGVKEFPELENYTLHHPIPECYITLQNSEPAAIAPVKVMLAHQKFPIMMLDMRTAMYVGESLGDMAIDINQAQVMDIIQYKRENDQISFGYSIFEVQDVDGNIYTFRFDFTKRGEVKKFKELHEISLIQFKSNDLGLPTLIIDLINEEKVEVDLNIQQYITILQEISEMEPSENSYKIQIPFGVEYIIIYIDFNDETLLDRLRAISTRKELDPTVQVIAEVIPKQIFTFNFTDGDGNVWEISVDILDYFTREQLFSLSDPNANTEADYVIIDLVDQAGAIRNVYLNRFDVRTLEFLKEITQRTIGRPATIIYKYEQPKDLHSLTYIDSYGQQHNYIVDMNNKDVITELRQITKASNGLGVTFTHHLGNGKSETYQLNLENPAIRSRCEKLRDFSVFDIKSGNLRKKRSIHEDTVITHHKVSTKHFRNILKIETPASGILTMNFGTEDRVTRERLSKLATNKKTTHPLVVHLHDHLQNPYSIQLDQMNPKTLRELLIINKDLKKLPTPLETIDKILYRFKTIEVMDPLEKIFYTFDLYQEEVIKTLSDVKVFNRKGVSFEFFNGGKLVKTHIDTTNEKIKSILKTITTPTLVPNYRKDMKLITFIFLRDTSNPLVLNLADRKTFVDFTNVAKNHPKGPRPSYFEFKDDSGQYVTISMDLNNKALVEELRNRWKEHTSVKITTEGKVYLQFCVPDQESSYKTFKVQVKTSAIARLSELPKTDGGFTTKIKFLDKSIVFNLNPRNQTLDSLLNEGHEVFQRVPSKFLTLYLPNVKKFFDVSLEDKNVVKYVKGLGERVNFEMPVSVVQLVNEECVFVNFDMDALLDLSHLASSDVGTHILLREKLQKIVNIRIPIDDKISRGLQLDLGDGRVVESLRSIKYSSKYSDPKIFYVDDAWKNFFLLRVHPADRDTINKLIHLSSK